MPAEVYSTTRPASPGRAWLVALVLLAAAAALAGDLVQRGAGTWRAGGLIQPEGWEMAFRHPAQFEEVDPQPDQFNSTYVYQYRQRDSSVIELKFWRLQARDATAITIAHQIQEKSKTWIGLLFGPAPTRAVGRLGDRDALEVVDPAISMALRTLVWESGWAYAVSIRVEGGPIDEKIYALFDMTCQSVRFRKPTV